MQILNAMNRYELSWPFILQVQPTNLCMINSGLIWLQKYFVKRSVNCGVMSPSMSFSFIVHFIYNLSTSNVHHLLGYQASFYFFFILCRKEWVTSNNDTMLLQQTWCIHLISSLLSLPFSDKSQIFTITTRVGHGTFQKGMVELF